MRTEVEPNPTLEPFPVGQRKDVTMADLEHLESLEAYEKWFQEVSSLPRNHIVTWQRYYIDQHFRPRPGTRILDVGAYIGNNLLRYGKEGHEIDGIEVGSGYCKTWSFRKATEMTPEEAGRTRMINCLFETWQPDRVYQHILCCEVLEHVIEPGMFVDKMAGVLQDAGELFIATPQVKTRTAVRLVAPKDMRRWVEEADMEVVEFIEAIPRKRTDGPTDWGVAQWICIARKQEADPA